MGKLWCPKGEHTVKVAFQPTAGERCCPDHGTHLQPLPRKPGAGLGARRESAAETRARQEFNRIVCSERCYYTDKVDGKQRREGHRCTYPLDAHHLVEKQWIRREFGDLPEDELLAVLYSPLIGAPLCRSGHENVKRLRIFWHEVSDECKEFCADVDRRFGNSHPSMLVRLKRECPPDLSAATHNERSNDAASG